MARTLIHCKIPVVRATADDTSRIPLPDKTQNSRVLVLGGTGRVGGSTAIALSKLRPNLRIIVAGRNREKGAAMVTSLGQNSEFSEIDINNVASLKSSLRDVDLVIHAAGPFQQAKNCNVLEAAIETKTAYLDVCDDTNYAFHAKSYKDKAVDAKVPAITTAGMIPGVSNLMAAELVRAARTESKAEPERLRFCYYAAGTGGAGPTLLASTLLLLGEEVVAYNKGEKIKSKPLSGKLNVDFGKGIGKRDVYLMNLPEVRSAHEVLGIPTVSARFGTSPVFWSWAMETMINTMSRDELRNGRVIQDLIEFIYPLARAFDWIVGASASIRVDLECSDGRKTVGIFSHRNLAVSVGNAVAAFALAMLEGNTQPGVWFPEEPEGIAIEDREVLLKRATQGAIQLSMNQSPWMVETEPKDLGLEIFI